MGACRVGGAPGLAAGGATICRPHARAGGQLRRHLLKQPTNVTGPPPPLDALEQCLEVCRTNYDACFQSLTHALTIDGVTAELRFQHLRYDLNGRPKFNDLAKCLADHIITYCFSVQRRGHPQTPQEWTKLAREARTLFRTAATGGESGEMLLYFLLEAVIGAPQMVAKMDLKTNRRLESHGGDGIHMKWHDGDGVLDVFFGEAKLEESLSNALTHAFESMTEFYDLLLDREMGLVTSHFKHADPTLKAAVTKYLDGQLSPDGARLNHACLIGFDWGEYARLRDVPLGDVRGEFERRYLTYAKQLRDLTKKRTDAFTHPRVRFTFFYLPFVSVGEFRAAFNRALHDDSVA